MSKEIEKQLEEHIWAKKDHIDRLNGEIIKLEHALLEEKTGFKDGDMVVDAKGQKGLLCHTQSYPSQWSWRKLKKDGTPSGAVTYVYSSQPIKKVED